MWIAGTIILFVLGIGLVLFNRLVRVRNLIDEAWSEIEVQLKMRHDLVPSLVKTVEEYVGHERALFDDIARLRSESISLDGLTHMVADENALSRHLKTLFGLVETHPDLKASPDLLSLRNTLSQIEDQIEHARRRYNSALRNYNLLIESFPSNLLAQPLGFHKEEFFEIEYATERKTP